MSLWVKKAGVPIVWAPQPGAQAALLSCPYDEILYGGAKGGGKSDGLLGDWLAHMSENRTNRRHARGIIFRKAYPELEQLMERAQAIFSRIPGARWVGGNRKTWYFAGGARLKFRFVESKKDAAKYQGHEYTWMAFDEVGEIADPEIINTLRGALRSTKVAKARLLLTGNPLGPGHKWLFDRFIKGKEAYEPYVEEITNAAGQKVTWTRGFIPAKLEDNPLLLLTQPQYELRLKQMCAGRPGLYKALRFGDWTAKIENPGALLTLAEFDEHRLSKHSRLDFEYIAIGVDPSGSSNPGADECGIIVSGAIGRHKYTLEDASCGGGPKRWGPKVVKTWHKWGADWVVGESNYGGEMVEETITKYDDEGFLKVELISVSRGKAIRATPTAAEYSRGFAHMIGEQEKLEEEWTTYVAIPGAKSPNRLDADVFSKVRLSNGSDGLRIRDL